MPSIADAMAFTYHGAEADVSTPGRVVFSEKATRENFQIPIPPTKQPIADIPTMLSKQSSGFPGDNLDIWA